MNYRDSPNAWPPHQYIALQALLALPANVSGGALPLPTSNQSTYDLVPPGQLSLVESDLPGQPIRASDLGPRNATSSGPDADINRLNGTVSHGGDPVEDEGWAHTLQRELANRYIANAFCNWYFSTLHLEPGTRLI
jgi:alpha,alpha-trehalase